MRTSRVSADRAWSSAVVLSASTPAVPASGSRRAELLLSGCLAAWVEVVGEAAGGPEHQQRGPEAVVQQGEDAWGPEEAWRTGLRAAK